MVMKTGVIQDQDLTSIEIKANKKMLRWAQTWDGPLPPPPSRSLPYIYVYDGCTGMKNMYGENWAYTPMPWPYQAVYLLAVVSKHCYSPIDIRQRHVQ